MKQIKEFINEDGFELMGYLSQLFEKASEENKDER